MLDVAEQLVVVHPEHGNEDEAQDKAEHSVLFLRQPLARGAVMVGQFTHALHERKDQQRQSNRHHGIRKRLQTLRRRQFPAFRDLCHASDSRGRRAGNQWGWRGVRCTIKVTAAVVHERTMTPNAKAGQPKAWKAKPPAQPITLEPR